MKDICSRCLKPWGDDDLAEVLVYVRVVPNKSRVVTTVSKPVDWEPGTLQHVFCDDPKGEREGIPE